MEVASSVEVPVHLSPPSEEEPERFHRAARQIGGSVETKMALIAARLERQADQEALQTSLQEVTACAEIQASQAMQQYVPPPGAGIGPGATPPSTGETASPMQAVDAVPMMPALAAHVMQTLHSKYEIPEGEAQHVVWLLSTGLIRDVDAEGVAHSLGV